MAEGILELSVLRNSAVLANQWRLQVVFAASTEDLDRERIAQRHDREAWALRPRSIW